MDKKQKIVIVGATSMIAEQCARLWIHHPIELLLIGRNKEKLEPIATDLRIRNPAASIQVFAIDMLNATTISETIHSIFVAGPVSSALIAHGMYPDQAHCQNHLSDCSAALNLNAISPVLFLEAFAMEMSKIGSGTIGIIGSVAGDRGRKKNYIYGAAKGLIHRYAEGLQHRLAGTDIKVVLIKPGPTATPMTAHLKMRPGSLAQPESVAKEIIQALAKGKPVLYTPSRWRFIMLIVRHIPSFIFNKMDF